MDNKKLVAKLKKYLSDPENTTVKLANLFGYSSSNVISMWISRGRVPKWQHERLWKIMEEKRSRG